MTEGPVAANAVPVTILTGFLGAGKTTLMNRILTGDHGLRAAALVNDFGTVNIDAELIVSVDADTVSLSNGCVCCQIRDDLVESVIELLDRPEGFDYVLLEASGVADPGGVALAFVDSELRDRLRLDSVTCVVDADQFLAHSEHPDLFELKLRQIAFSDFVILNKVDLASRAQVADVRAAIDARVNRVRTVEATHCDVPYEVLLGVGRFDPERVTPDGSDGTSAHGLRSSYFESERPLSLERLRETVRLLPKSVYRCKGIVQAAEEPDRRVLLQAVGRRVDLSTLDEWGDRSPFTRIVAIGESQEFDPVDLDQRLAACVVEDDPDA